MLMAKKKDNFPYPPLKPASTHGNLALSPGQTLPVEGNRRRQGSVTADAEKAIALVLVGLFFFAGFLIVAQAVRVVSKGYYLNQLKGEVVALERKNGQLSLEIAELRSLKRIENIAFTELGMQKPRLSDMEIVPLRQPMMLQAAEASPPVNGERQAGLKVLGFALGRRSGGQVAASEL